MGDPDKGRLFNDTRMQSRKRRIAALVVKGGASRRNQIVKLFVDEVTPVVGGRWHRT